MRMILFAVTFTATSAVMLTAAAPVSAKTSDPYMAACKRKFGPSVDSYKLGKHGQITCRYYKTVRHPMTYDEANRICGRMGGFAHGFVRPHKFADGSWVCMGK